MHFSTTPRKPRRGFSLIEVILALGVVSASVLALIGILGSTFSSAREIALQHRAINAVTQLDGAFQSASGITGLTGDPNLPAFDRIYKVLAAKPALDGKSFIDIFVYQKNDDRSPSVPVVYMSPSGRFTIEEAKATGGLHEGIDTATVFRMRVRVSALLAKKLYKLDQSTYEPTSEQLPESFGQPGGSGSLPPTADEYALAYLPLSVEIFPHDFSGGTDPGNNSDATKELVKPILTQTVVINR